MRSVREIAACQLCGADDLGLMLDMGMQPLSERHDSDRLYPLRLLECGTCGLVQSGFIPDQREVFPLDHPYATGNTKFLRDHFAALAQELGELLEPDDLACDIGANDGTLLRAIRDDVRKLAIEPTAQVQKCLWDRIQACQRFFTADVARQMLIECGPAKVITACNVLAHVPDAHDFMSGVYLLLADDGTFVTENHDLRSITEGLQVDSVYHEHARYWDVATLSRLLAIHGLDVVSAVPIPTHGGSFRVTARKRSEDLADRARRAALDLNGLLAGITEAGALVYGVGATTRATPLIFFADIARYITCVCEVSSSAKIGLMMPATQIPVVDEVRLIEDQPAYALLFSWHIADSLMPKLRSMGYKGRFLVPLPGPEVIDD